MIPGSINGPNISGMPATFIPPNLPQPQMMPMMMNPPPKMNSPLTPVIPIESIDLDLLTLGSKAAPKINSTPINNNLGLPEGIIKILY